MTRALLLSLSLAALGLSGCVKDVDAGGEAKVVTADDDPLDVPMGAADGTLEALHRNIVMKSCAAQPGLCHSGQFEPNMSTPALMYANLVRRPSLEHPNQLRIDPEAPEKSLVIDKLRDHMVISQMPLGAAPLAESDIEAIEKWIKAGALRAPGDPQAPVLNNPPEPPRIAVFDDTGARLDSAGPFVVAAGQHLTFRMTVHDFETPDAKMPFAIFELQTHNGMQIELTPNDPMSTSFLGSYDPTGAPLDKKDPLDWKFDYTLPAQLALTDGTTTSVEDTGGQQLSVIAIYADGDLEKDGILTYSVALDVMGVMK